MTTTGFTRRQALAGAGLGLALPVLAACGQGAAQRAKKAASKAAAQGKSAASGAASRLAAAADIPVNGGKVFGDQRVVVTQPDQGDFKAFSAVCTHQGCLVSTVAHDQIRCPCHGSLFSAEDGSVIQGPATRPLPTVKITVDSHGIHLTPR